MSYTIKSVKPATATNYSASPWVWAKVHAGRYAAYAPDATIYTAQKFTGPGGGVYWIVAADDARIPSGTARTLAEAKEMARNHAAMTEKAPEVAAVAASLATIEEAPADYECVTCGRGPLTYGELDSAGRCADCVPAVVYSDAGYGGSSLVIPAKPRKIPAGSPEFHEIQAALVDRVTSYAAAAQHARELADQKRDDLMWSVRKSVSEGLSEYAAANAAGVTRQTVRAWLGK